MSAQFQPSSVVVDGMQNGNLRRRFLDDESKSGIEMKSPVMIAWYCMIATIVIPFCLCVFYMWQTKHLSYRRAQLALERERQLEDELAVSRIEANVKIYSEAEKFSRARIVKASIRNQIKCMTMHDVCPEKTKQMKDCEDGSESRSDEDTTGSMTNVCSICLEDFKSGDKYAHSSNALCQHIFHVDCIVSWLVTRQGCLCPCCRQPFTCLQSTHTPQTSITSQEHFSAVFGGSGIGDMDNRQVADDPIEGTGNVDATCQQNATGSSTEEDIDECLKSHLEGNDDAPGKS